MTALSVRNFDGARIAGPMPESADFYDELTEMLPTAEC